MASARGGHVAAGLSAKGLPAQWPWLIPVVVVAAVVAWLAGRQSGLEAGALRGALLALGAILTAVAVGLPLWMQVRLAWARADAVASAEAARAEMRIAMEDTLDPIVALLLQMADTRGAERARLRGEAIQLALTALAAESVFAERAEPEGRRIRACLFMLEEGPPRRLVPQSYAGRSGTPTVEFDETTRAGQTLLRNVDDGWVVVPSLKDQRYTPWWDAERQYGTYVAGPVLGTDGAPVALLTLDALRPGALEGIDLPLVRLIAHLLSLAHRL